MEERYHQLEPRPGIIELAFGEPDLSLLPDTVVERCCRRAVAEHGRRMLPYGANEGPIHLRRMVRDLVTRLEGREPDLDALVLTGGNSHAFSHVLNRFIEPGDVVFVEQPTYSLALLTLRDHGVAIEPVAIDEDGLDIAALEEAVRAARQAGRRPRLLYAIPTFHNPAGVCLSGERRRRLVDLAAAEELLIVEDDAYRELWYDEEAPPSLWSLAPDGVVLRLGTFSKTIAPGLRTGWMNASAAQADRYADSGLLESGGHVSTFAVFITAQFLADGLYPDHVALLRRVYRERRDALAAELARELPAGCSFVTPHGGFFIRVTLPEGVRASELLPVAEAGGVSFQPGTRNQLAGGEHALRLGFTFYRPPQLAEGVARLAAAIDEVAARR
jgi:2-aminoadipate transaminase